MMRRRRPSRPHPTAPDSLPNTPASEPERARAVNELLEQRGLERPQIDAWWGTRLEDNGFRARTEMWEDGEFDEVERQARLHAQ
jgi:hypothetical protein